MFERTIGGGASPEPVPVSTASAETPGSQPAPAALRLQILSTEHWSLLASRSLAWNESFSRAGMFLSTLSFAIVALALVGQASAFGDSFRVFALVVLPIVLFVGIGTVLRIGMSNYHDAVCVVGMNRIRAGYLELAPDLERFFVMGVTDDPRGIATTMALGPAQSMPVQMLASTPMLVSVLNSVVFAAILAVLALQLGASTPLAIGVGAIGFIVGMAAHLSYARHRIRRGVGQTPRFPSRGET